jgi:hypothetical protein
MEICDPNRAISCNDNADPSRARLRTLRELPSIRKSKIDTLEPKRCCPKTDMPDPM